MGADVPAAAQTQIELLAQKPSANRILDADGSSGMELIKQIKADTALRNVPVMLVSNYDHYQEEAVKEGALKGFGKGALGQPQTIARLKSYLSEE